MPLSIGRLIRFAAVIGLPVVGALFAVDGAQALPSFTRQTGLACSTCHVGSMGPQLTPQGRMFKLEGYTDSKPPAEGDPAWLPPLSAMVIGSGTHTAKAQAEKPDPHFSRNNNFAVDETSVFLAGKIVGPVGAFVQGTYDGIGRSASLDHADIRATRTIEMGGSSLLLGFDVNNNPTVQDAWNTLPAWGFPYTASGLVPEPAAATMLDGGLEHSVVGASVYALWDKSWYAEFAVYKSLSASTLDFLGIDPADTNRVFGLAPYWRFAWQKSFDGQYVSIGTFGLYSAVYPGRDRSSGETDNYLDWGFDATYQFLGTRKHVASVNAALINERRTMNATMAMGEADNLHQQLHTAKINASYYYDQTYGFTLGYFNTWGSRDQTYYGEDSRTGKPNTSGIVAQIDWTPFGKADSFAAPWINLRLGLQYTAYMKFNGSSNNYDGSGRDASANNTIYGFVWLAF